MQHHSHEGKLGLAHHETSPERSFREAKELDALLPELKENFTRVEPDYVQSISPEGDDATLIPIFESDAFPFDLSDHLEHMHAAIMTAVSSDEKFDLSTLTFILRGSNDKTYWFVSNIHVQRDAVNKGTQHKGNIWMASVHPWKWKPGAEGRDGVIDETSPAQVIHWMYPEVKMSDEDFADYMRTEQQKAEQIEEERNE